jgi:hypothetical protein
MEISVARQPSPKASVDVNPETGQAAPFAMAVVPPPAISLTLYGRSCGAVWAVALEPKPINTRETNAKRKRRIARPE